MGCHVTSTVNETKLDGSRWISQPDTAKMLGPRAAVTASGHFRFLYPLQCMGDVVGTETTHRVRQTRPNLAVLVVGILATSAGVVFSAAGLAGDDPSGSPATYSGFAGLAVGIPLIAGPLLGNSSHRDLVRTRTIIRGTRIERCGDKPMTAGPTIVHYHDLVIPGIIDKDGVFSVSPFTFVDAFHVHRNKVLDIKVLTRGVRPFTAQVSASDLAKTRVAFLAAHNIVGKSEPLKKVPRLRIAAFHIKEPLGTPFQAQIQIAVHNEGPGDAWGVRAIVSSPDPQLDARIVYFGRIPPRTRQTQELKVPTTRRGKKVSQSTVTLMDVHNTAPSTPTRIGDW